MDPLILPFHMRIGEGEEFHVGNIHMSVDALTIEQLTSKEVVRRSVATALRELADVIERGDQT